MLFFVQLLSGNFIINGRALQPLHSHRFVIQILSSLLNGVKDAAFAEFTASKFAFFRCLVQRRNVHTKSKPMWKLKRAGILESLEYFCQISAKLILINFSYTVSKLVHFLRHSVDGNPGCQPGLATSFQLVRLVGCGLKRISLPTPPHNMRRIITAHWSW